MLRLQPSNLPYLRCILRRNKSSKDRRWNRRYVQEKIHTSLPSCADLMIDYDDGTSMQQVQFYVYSPGENNNGNLIMIANGKNVKAEEYSSMSWKLVKLGYSVLVANCQTVIPGSNSRVVGSNLNLLNSILKNLVDGQKMNKSFPHLNITNVVLFGHSWGGNDSVICATKTKDCIEEDDNLKQLINIPFFRNNSKLVEYLNKCSPSIDDKVWNKYVKGAVVFEGWQADYLPSPQKQQFLVLISSQYFKDIVKKWASQRSQESATTFYVIENTNHYLINNFQDKKQVIAGCIIAQGQEEFTTTYDEWEHAHDNFVKILDYELKQRLGSSQANKPLPCKQLKQLVENEDSISQL